METENLLKELSKPFHPSQVQWKPGTVKGDRALAMPYADLRVYMARLDEVCGMNWSIEYKPWGDNRIIACLTINGVTRCSTGEMSAQDEKNEMGGTVAEAQAAKRACAFFSLGRYLYNLPTGWADYDPAKRQFTEQAKFKLTGILVAHYRRATDGKLEHGDVADDSRVVEPGDVEVSPEIEALLGRFHQLGQDLYADQWEKVCRRNVNRISGGEVQSSEGLSAEQLKQLITGMMKLKSERHPASEAA